MYCSLPNLGMADVRRVAPDAAKNTVEIKRDTVNSIGPGIMGQSGCYGLFSESSIQQHESAIPRDLPFVRHGILKNDALWLWPGGTSYVDFAKEKELNNPGWR